MRIGQPTIRLVLAGLAFCFALPLTFGQEVRVVGVAGDGEGLSEEMQERLADGAASFSFVSPGSSFSFGSSIGGVDPSNRSQLFNLLSNESVRDELKLTDEQYGGVKKIMQASQKRMSELVREQMASRGEGGAIRIGGTAFREMMQENQEQAEQAIEEILLPEQLERIEQLAYQVEVSQSGMGDALVDGRLGREIGVHDDQKQHLLDRAAKIDLEVKAAVVRIKAEARAKLFKELTPEQRKAAEELLGDYFEYEELSLGQQLRKSFRSIGTTEEDTEADD